jgi:hypothetical protein
MNLSGRVSNIVMTDGDVTINGVRIDPALYQNQPAQPKTKITIKLPSGTTFDLTGSGSSTVKCTARLGDSFIELSGNATANLYAVSEIQANLSGASNLVVDRVTGDCVVDCSGASHATLRVNFCGNVKASSSGASHISTSGTCGDYTASASGVSGIDHCGTITGRRRESKSGLSRISL